MYYGIWCKTAWRWRSWSRIDDGIVTSNNQMLITLNWCSKQLIYRWYGICRYQIINWVARALTTRSNDLHLTLYLQQNNSSQEVSIRHIHCVGVYTMRGHMFNQCYKWINSWKTYMQNTTRSSNEISLSWIMLWSILDFDQIFQSFIFNIIYLTILTEKQVS